MKDDILNDILADKYLEIQAKKEAFPLKRLCPMAFDTPESSQKMSKCLKESASGLICEFKRRSPSKGWIHPDAAPDMVVHQYAAAGATALSVLTDQKYFGSQKDDFQLARRQTKLPMLRKEFIIDEYQVFESRLLGADALLLIAAALDRPACNRLAALAAELHMEVLLEIHREEELEYITPDITMVGINNRNLGTFQTNVEHSFQLCSKIPGNILKISESGISDPHTVAELREAGFQGFLIGETFMRTAEPGLALSRFLTELTHLQNFKRL